MAMTMAMALNATVYGNGTETLVLSHGYGSDQNVWNYVLPYLLCCFKVVVFNLAFAAKGDSPIYDSNRYSSYNGYAQDLQKLLEELQMNNTIFVGHSMSAMIGCIAATQSPHLFKRVILLNGSPRYLNDMDYIGGFGSSDIEAIFVSIKDDYYGWVNKFAPMAIGVNDTKAIQEIERSLKKKNPDIALEVAKTVFLSDYRSVLPSVKVPVTVIQSEKDIIVPLSVTRYMKNMLGGSTKVKILLTEGHFPQLTEYKLLANVIRRVCHV